MICGIIQARVGSSRLPDKIFADIVGHPLIWHIINRLRKSEYLDEIILATTLNPVDDKLESWCVENNIKCYRGDEENVLKRFYDAASLFKADIIVRITADDPFKDYLIMDAVIELFLNEDVDFACNNMPPTFPEGLDIEVFSYESIGIAFKNAKTDFEKEHVTQYFYKNPELFKIAVLKNNINLSHLRWTIDEEQDLKMAKIVYEKLSKKNKIFLMEDILELILNHPEIPLINKEINRSSMYKND